MWRHPHSQLEDWFVVWTIEQGNDHTNRSVLYQDDFDVRFDIVDINKQNTGQMSFNDCIIHCFNVTQYTHFSYSSCDRICSLKNAPPRTDRIQAWRRGRRCGFIPDRIQLEENSIDKLLAYAVPAVVIVILLLTPTFFVLVQYIVRQ